MSVDISRLAFSVCKAFEGSFAFHPLSRGHALELVAAALGYRSLAAYKAAVAGGVESADLARASDIVILYPPVFKRVRELNSMASSLTRLELVLQAFKDCLPDVRLWKDEATLVDGLVELVQSATYNHEKTGSAIASANGIGVHEIYMPFDFALSDLPPLGESLQLDILGHVTMKVDDERPNLGQKIDVQASLQVERLGRMAIARPVFQLENAQLNYN
jgi:hypothetical protein